jgi:NAD(P)-dependent dehydrogenase (short-subunit alcohol dehydrogenase family)
MYNPLAIAGKTILVTGAASGIGRQCAVDFSNAGANLILLDLNHEALATTKELCNPEVKCFCGVVDLTLEEAVTAIVSEAVAAVAPIDGLLHCAGIEKTLPFHKLSGEDYKKIYNVNVLGSLNVMKPIMKGKNHGENTRFVLISSITSLVGRPGVAAYAASKGAIQSMVKTIALEIAPKGMTINCISPGTILTPLMQQLMESLTEEQRKERQEGFPLGLGKPSDIANAAMFLLSDGARWITGQNIVVDGGYTSR